MKKDVCKVNKNPPNWSGSLRHIYLYLPDTKHKFRIYKDHNIATGEGIYHMVILPTNGRGRKQLADTDKTLAKRCEIVCDVCNNKPSINPTSYYIDIKWSGE